MNINSCKYYIATTGTHKKRNKKLRKPFVGCCEKVPVGLSLEAGIIGRACNGLKG